MIFFFFFFRAPHKIQQKATQETRAGVCCLFVKVPPPPAKAALVRPCIVTPVGAGLRPPKAAAALLNSAPGPALCREGHRGGEQLYTSGRGTRLFRLVIYSSSCAMLFLHFFPVLFFCFVFCGVERSGRPSFISSSAWSFAWGGKRRRDLFSLPPLAMAPVDPAATSPVLSCTHEKKAPGLIV